MSGTTVPTDAELDRARAFIAACRWTYAKTVPEHPHEYCLRAWLEPEQQIEFDWLAGLIAQHGYPGRFWNATWTYLDVDEHKIWQSRELFGDGPIVNRARLEPEPPAEPLTAARMGMSHRVRAVAVRPPAR